MASYMLKPEIAYTHDLAPRGWLWYCKKDCEEDLKRRLTTDDIMVSDHIENEMNIDIFTLLYQRRTGADLNAFLENARNEAIDDMMKYMVKTVELEIEINDLSEDSEDDEESEEEHE